MAVQGNPQTRYIQAEGVYAYCATCGRKSYNLQNLVFSTNGTATVCGAFNSAPQKHPQAPCQGTMTIMSGERNMLFGSGGNLVNDERSFS